MKSSLFTRERIYMWELYPHMLQWHQHHRQFIQSDMEGDPRKHINALLILSSAIMVESTLKSLLLFYCEGPFSPLLNSIKIDDPESLLHISNREALISKVNSSTWSESQKIFSEITGKRLAKITEPCWIEITNLFRFRNFLAHGNQVVRLTEWDRNQGLKASTPKHSNAEKLFKYLESKKLISKPKFGKNLGWTFLSDEIADHFLSNARRFLQILADDAPDSSESETLPKRIKYILDLTKPDHCKPEQLLYKPNQVST